MKTAQGVTLIANGQLVDGTGAAPVPDAAVVIKDGKITYAGPARGRTARSRPTSAASTPAAGRSCRGWSRPIFIATYFDVAELADLDIKYPGRIRDDPGRVQRPAARSNAATRRRGAAAACTTSTSGSRRRSRRT